MCALSNSSTVEVKKACVCQKEFSLFKHFVPKDTQKIKVKVSVVSRNDEKVFEDSNLRWF